MGRGHETVIQNIAEGTRDGPKENQALRDYGAASLSLSPQSSAILASRDEAPQHLICTL